MNIKTYRKDIIPGWLIVKAARYAIEHPPRVNFLDKAIMITIIVGLGWLTVAILRWVVKT